jgi:hypothetical protein
MGGYPALAIRPPESPLETYGRLAQLQGLQQESQLRGLQIQQGQLDIQSRKAVIDAFNAHSGVIDDNMISDAGRRGASPNDLMALQQHKLQIANSLNALTESQIKLKATQNDNVLGAFRPVYNAPDEQKQAAWSAARQRVLADPASYGSVNPQEVPEIFPGKEAGQLLFSGLQGNAIQFKNEQEERKTAAEEQKAGAAATEAQTKAAEFKAHLPGEALNPVTIATQEATSPAIQGAKLNLARAEGEARAAIEAGMIRGGDEDVKNVAPRSVNAAKAEAAKAGTKYSGVASQIDKIKTDIAAAQTGDQVANAFAPVATVLGSNAFFGTHRFSPTELQTFGPQLGSWGRQLNSALDKAAKGKLPTATLNEFKAMADRLSDAAFEEYGNSLKVTNDVYKSTFKPAKIGEAAKQGGFFSQFGGTQR